MSLEDQKKQNEQRAVAKARELFEARNSLWAEERRLYEKAKDLEWHEKQTEAKEP